MPSVADPAALAAIPPKITADNGGTFEGLLQNAHREAFVADPTDLATALTATIAIRDALIALGLMKAA
jgi:hypothetical protein